MATNIAEPNAAGASPSSAHLQLEDRVWLLRAMLLMRGLEERAMTLYRQGKVPGSFYDGYGQEAVSAGAAFAMGPKDPPHPRGHAGPNPGSVHGPRERHHPGS